MRKRRRRFEVLLPLQFNDGRPVPERLLGKAIRESRDDDLVEWMFCVEPDKSIDCGNSIWIGMVGDGVNDGCRVP